MIFLKLLSEASHIKKEYDDLNSKLSKLQSRIHHLKEKNKHDFGKLFKPDK